MSRQPIPTTPHHAIEVFRDWLDDLAGAGVRLNQRDIAALFLGPVYRIEELLDEVERAVLLLEDGVPLADTYPDGTPAERGLYTPRQVFALARVSPVRTDPKDAAHLEILHNVRARLGRNPPAVCSATTNAGRPCSGYALAYGSEGRCHSHASAEDREHNQKMKREEVDMVQRALRGLGLA